MASKSQLVKDSSGTCHNCTLRATTADDPPLWSYATWAVCATRVPSVTHEVGQEGDDSESSATGGGTPPVALMTQKAGPAARMCSVNSVSAASVVPNPWVSGPVGLWNPCRVESPGETYTVMSANMSPMCAVLGLRRPRIRRRTSPRARPSVRCVRAGGLALPQHHREPCRQ